MAGTGLFPTGKENSNSLGDGKSGQTSPGKHSTFFIIINVAVVGGSSSGCPPIPPGPCSFCPPIPPDPCSQLIELSTLDWPLVHTRAFAF